MEIGSVRSHTITSLRQTAWANSRKSDLKRDLYPSQLSGGQQQLAAVAREVIAHAKLMLADEPTDNLDSSQGKEIMGRWMGGRRAQHGSGKAV